MLTIRLKEDHKKKHLILLYFCIQYDEQDHIQNTKNGLPMRGKSYPHEIARLYFNQKYGF